MSTTQEPVSLDQLAEGYEIIGELAGRDDARTYVATRRSDNAAVLIAVARTPADDEGNALSLLAADTNLLATLTHRNLLPVLEGRWVGTDAFAVISERLAAPTLEELLAREKFSFQRIAAILQEVNGLLEWARGRKIVHRVVTSDTLHMEPGSDRVLASFAISPIPFGRTSPIGVDARTIGGLAQAMLAHQTDLATQVVEQTEALLQLSHTSETVPDIPGFIASIAMADALKRGEIEYARASNAIGEQQRMAREQLEAERKEHEREMDAQKQDFDKQRQEFERELAKERKALAKEREGLVRERAAHERDRESLVNERDAHRRDREQFEAATAALEGRAKLYRPTEPVPVMADEREHEHELSEAEVHEPPEIHEPREIHEAPELYEPREPQLAHPVPDKPRRVAPLSAPDGRGKWNIGLVAAALVVIAGASTLAVGSGRGKSTPQSQANRTPVTRVEDSAAGGIAPSGFASVVPLPRNVPDSVMNAAAQADSAAQQARRERTARRAAARRDSIKFATFVQQETPAQPDSATLLMIAPPGDSAAKRDSVAKPRTDTLPRRDTVPKVDTLGKRDTTALR